MRCYSLVPMRYGYNLLAILIAASTASLHAQESHPETSAQAFLTISCTHAGLPVLIDGVVVGSTPLLNYPVVAGEHALAVRCMPFGSWMDSDWVDTVTVAAGDTVELEARFLIGYTISSSPYGAQVWVDGRIVGTTPFVLRLPEGKIAQVELSMSGYRPAYLTVGIASPLAAVRGSKRRYEVVLQEDFNYAVLQERESLQHRNRLRRYRRLTYISAGISLAAGVAAVLFKHEADATYNRYLVVGDPIKRERAFDRALQYDRYSGAAFAVFQISFAFSVYSFLKAMR